MADADKSITGYVLFVRVLVFLGFATSSLVGLIIFWSSLSSGRCAVRHSYSPRHVESLTTNTMYSSTGVLSRPPPSRMASLGHSPPSSYGGRGADVAGFPVVVANPVRSASFLVSPISSGAMAPPSPSATPEALARLLLTSFLLAMGVPSPDPASSGGGATLGGAEVSSVQHMLGLGIPGFNDTAMRGVVPNLARCVTPSDGHATNITQYHLDILAVAASTHTVGACLLSGQHRMVDVSFGADTSIVPFSTTDPMFVATAMVWVSASFALFSLGQMLKDRRKNLCSLASVLAIVWNLFMIGFAGFTIFDGTVPANNCLVVAIACAAAIGVQGYYGAFDDAIYGLNLIVGKCIRLPSNAKIQPADGTTKAGLADRGVALPGAIVGVRYGIVTPASAAQPSYGSTPTRRKGYQALGDVESHAPAATTSSGGVVWIGRGGVMLGEKIPMEALAESLEENAESLRFWEYAITTPALFAACVAAASPSATVQTILAVYGVSLAFVASTNATSTFVRIVNESDNKNTSDVAMTYAVLALASLTLGGCLAWLVLMDPDVIPRGGSSQGLALTLVVTHCVWICVYLSATIVGVYTGGYGDTAPLVIMGYSVINVAQKASAWLMVVIMFQAESFPQLVCGGAWVHHPAVAGS